MKTIRRRFCLRAAVVLVAALVVPMIAAGQITCNASSLVPSIVRVDGKTEPVGDVVVTCTGGVPTVVGSPVPQEKFSIFLNTNLTNKVTAASQFSEALLLVDEPNTATIPQHPLLNCGQAGAPDSGILGPGVCAIISDGVSTDTYDGIANAYGTGVCGPLGPPTTTYGCGRPNAFQGQLVMSGSTTLLNAVVFPGVPFDPPGGGSRVFHFTNLRANASILGMSGRFMPIPIHAFISVSGTRTPTIRLTWRRTWPAASTIPST